MLSIERLIKAFVYSSGLSAYIPQYIISNRLGVLQSGYKKALINLVNNLSTIL